MSTSDQNDAAGTPAADETEGSGADAHAVNASATTAPNSAGAERTSGSTEDSSGTTAAGEFASLLDSEDEYNYKEAAEQFNDYGAYEDKNAPLSWGIIIPSMAVVIAIVVWGLTLPDSFAAFANDAFAQVIDKLGWAFVLFGTVFVAFILYVALSKFGNINLGADDDAPEFSTPSWIAMMFAAGMGIGLMFFGTSEPLTFFRNGVPGHPDHQASSAFASTLFHWTLHPWAIYAIVGLAIAYSTFRLGRKQLLSSAFIPLIGERGANGIIGKMIDILAVIATVFGTAASLGIGALQIKSGLDASGVIEDPQNSTVVMIVLILTVCFIISAMSGVGKGIQYISNANMVLAALLAIFVFAMGPTVNVLNMLPTSVSSYFSQFFEMAARTANNGNPEAAAWVSGWTIFYWAWWISWSPFVGMFLARISRGRTVREFILGVLLVPTAVSAVWFSIFGGTAITFEQRGESIWGDGDSQRQLFDLLHQLPGGFIAGFVAMVLLSTFFITSADSASTVMGSLSQNGAIEANRFVSAAWGILTAGIGLTLLLIGDGQDSLQNLQNVTIVAASPFLVVIILLMVALHKDLSNDKLYLDHKEQQRWAMKLARERRVYNEWKQAQQRRSEVRRKARKMI
ncbi:BCCT family transporter [Corynebacterium sp. TAE3-ERU30]|uniref:BCCT family transporter n=1 Tax=Corynebacterium sp. TAE3-ERU30 TaxID=2849496 RepID=UPI001C43E895|nr:BCCT family transporter [Corynebacterium sp. TAE3-ERU30]MBV7281309.1 BCCT family transporter [Corynebacterium sp. TAE3-ERU30]